MERQTTIQLYHKLNAQQNNYVKVVVEGCQNKDTWRYHHPFSYTMKIEVLLTKRIVEENKMEYVEQSLPSQNFCFKNST